jgi:ankyrin repeat protein
VLLHLAAERLFKWNANIVHFLLDNGIDIEAKDTASRTPLIWACATGKTDMVKLMLEAKVKPDLEA